MMTRTLSAALLAFALTAGLARAQERHLMPAGDALDVDTCRDLARDVMARIEGYTRMRFRRSVPVRVQPKAEWDQALKSGGFGGRMAKAGAAFYNIVGNDVTVVPWVIGGYLGGSPVKRTRREWMGVLEPILVHELTHAIHHQNFYVLLGGARTATLKASGLTEEELDEGTVEFLLSEGFSELVAHRTATPEARPYLMRRPTSELTEPRRYMLRYQPDGKGPYRVKLSDHGYQDGIDLLHYLTLRVGSLGVRALLYRPPPRVLFFQPNLLGELTLDDPPEPDSVLTFLSPEVLQGSEIHLTVNPGAGRFFLDARQGEMRLRAPGCLVGYATSVGEESDANGQGRYAFFVADPDRTTEWVADQAASLKAMNPSGASESTKPLPLTQGVKARVISVKDNGLYVYAETGGLVVIAHESKPSPNLERRVLLALSALHIKRPTPGIYTAATEKARAALPKD